MRLCYQAIPGRSGARLDGLDLNPARMGLGTPFPATAPEPQDDPPPLRRWRERFGDHLDSALAGEVTEILPGEGTLFERHRAWSLERAQKLILAPRQTTANRKLVRERERLTRYGEALQGDRTRHETALQLRAKAQALASELWHLKGTAGRVELTDGTVIQLPEGLRAEGRRPEVVRGRQARRTGPAAAGGVGAGTAAAGTGAGSPGGSPPTPSPAQEIDRKGLEEGCEAHGTRQQAGRQTSRWQREGLSQPDGGGAGK